MNGKYGFDGAWKPNAAGLKIAPGQQTFSLGVFPWVPKSKISSGAYKRGKVVTRVVGSTDDPQRAVDLAQRIVDALASGRIGVESLQKRYDARSTVYDGWLV